jgi:hypothetical protein
MLHNIGWMELIVLVVIGAVMLMIPVLLIGGIWMIVWQLNKRNTQLSQQLPSKGTGYNTKRR